MTVDQTTGKIYAVDISGECTEGASNLLRFPPDSTGNVAPFARSDGSLQPAKQIASDSSGLNIIESHGMECCNSLNDGVTIMAKQFANGAGPAGVTSILPFNVFGVADDPTTKVYLASGSGIIGTGPNLTSGIFRFAERT